MLSQFRLAALVRLPVTRRDEIRRTKDEGRRAKRPTFSVDAGIRVGNYVLGFRAGDSANVAGLAESRAALGDPNSCEFSYQQR